MEKFSATLPGMLPMPSSPSVSPANSGTPSTGAAGAAPSAAKSTAVKDMQALMLTLAEAMVKEYPQISAVIKAMGTADGAWGGKTTAALEALKPEVGDLITQTTPDKVEDNAKHNTDLITGFMADNYVDSLPAAAIQSITVDTIPSTITAANADPKASAAEDAHPVTLRDMDNLWSFYSMVARLGISPKSANYKELLLKKLAKDIVDSLIVRNAQAFARDYMQDAATEQKDDAALEAFQEGKEFDRDVRRSQGRQVIEQAQKPEVQPSSDLLTVKQFDDAIKWFSQRAGKNLRTVEYGLRGRQKKPDGTRYTQDDLAKAEHYYNAMSDLSTEYVRQRARFVPKGSSPSHALLDPRDLGTSAADAVSQQAGAQRAPGRRRSQIGGEGEDVELASAHGPISGQMDLYDSLFDFDTPDAQWLSKYVMNPTFDRGTIRNLSAQSVADAHMNEEARKAYKNTGSFVIQLASSLASFLNQLNARWQNTARERLNTDMFHKENYKQKHQIEQWITTLGTMREKGEGLRKYLGGTPARRRV